MKKVFKTAAFLLAMGLMTSTFTSCGEDENDETGTEDGSVEEQMKFNNLTAIANPDGTITIGGSITTNTKLKEFCLYNEDGKTVAYNFLEKNKAVKEKNEVLDENGKASKEKQFTLNIESATVPVAIYKLAIKTKGSKTQDETIGKTYTFTCGAGKNSSLGSYISFVQGKSFSSGEVKTMTDKVIDLVCQDDGTFQVPSASNNKYDCFGKAVVYNAEGKKVTSANAGTIITESGCIATYKAEAAGSSSVDFNISGVVITSEGTLKIDTEKVKSDLAK